MLHVLTHWGQVTYTCVINMTIIDSEAPMQANLQLDKCEYISTHKGIKIQTSITFGVSFYSKINLNIEITYLHRRKAISNYHPFTRDISNKLILILYSDVYMHDDVIKWKHFPRNWPFVRGIHRSRWIPHTKASDAELWFFLWSVSE